MKWDWATSWKNLKKHHYFSWIILGILSVIMYFVMFSGVVPKKLDIKLHDIAKFDVQSPIEIIDTQATEKERQEAAASTPATFIYNKNASMIQVEKAEDVFSVIENVRDQSGVSKTNATNQSMTSNSANQNITTQTDSKTKPMTLTEEVKLVRNKLANTADSELSDATIKAFLTTTKNQLDLAKDMTSTAIYEGMKNKIKWGDLEQVQQNAAQSVPTSHINKDVRQAIIDMLNYAIVPNYVLDAQATKKNRNDAYKSVDNVVIHQGEVLVKKGQLVTQDVMQKLKAVGLLDDKFNPLPFIGLAILVAFLTLVLAYDLNVFMTKSKQPSTVLLIFTVIFVFVMMMMKIGSLLTLTNLTGIRYIVPVAAGTMMIKMLLNERLAIVSSIVFGISGSIIYQAGGVAGFFNFQMGVYLLFSSLAGAIIVRRYHAKQKLLQSGLVIALVNLVLILSVIFIKNGTFHLVETSLDAGFAILSGFISTVLTLGLVPFFEAAFGILSTTKLIELSNPNHPLLRKILMEAPGTYHHSVMVANLAEQACEQIGANGFLARVASYYHDIGKTKRPHFFIENQLNQLNPHDKISPQLSKTIIIAHPYDGASMLREYNIPKEIIDITEQHHGTTLLKYFYHKANEDSNQVIPESDFRYPGPKVQTREAAVVELADSVEAAVRSLSRPTPVKIEGLVQKILNDRLEDGQFDECDLTIKELYIIKQSICETLNGIFHSRIEYPEEINKKVNSG